MNSKYEAVRSAVVAANKELMELSFGCEISGNGLSYAKLVRNSREKAKVIRNGSVFLEDIKWEDGYKVHGHEPQLQHVLRAINKSSKKPVEITTFGMFISEIYDWRNEPCIYDLSKPFSQQSEEVYEFLYDLICKAE